MISLSASETYDRFFLSFQTSLIKCCPYGGVSCFTLCCNSRFNIISILGAIYHTVSEKRINPRRIADCLNSKKAPACRFLKFKLSVPVFYLSLSYRFRMGQAMIECTFKFDDNLHIFIFSTILPKEKGERGLRVGRGRGGGRGLHS